MRPAFKVPILQNHASLYLNYSGDRAFKVGGGNLKVGGQRFLLILALKKHCA